MINTKELAIVILLIVVALILTTMVIAVINTALDAKLNRWDKREKMKIHHQRMMNGFSEPLE